MRSLHVVAAILSGALINLFSALPAMTMAENIEPTDPAQTRCAPFVSKLRQGSIGGFVMALDMRPVTRASSVDAPPGETSLYTDQAGVIVMPVDPASHAILVKGKYPAWLLISFDADPAAAGTLRRTVGYATRKDCRTGESQSVRIEDAPRDLKRHLLRALTDLLNGGRGDPYGISSDEAYNIDNIFPTSVDARLREALQTLSRRKS